MGDVKTAFLQGDGGEGERDVYADPPADVKRLLGMEPGDVMKLMRAAYGLRNAPKAWFDRVTKDLVKLGWCQSQLDQCVFMKYDKAGKLLGIIGVYVDDFLMAGNLSDPRWKADKQKVIELYKWGKWETGNFILCGVQYRTRADKTIDF